MDLTTRGGRLTAIRWQYGDGRKPEPLGAFSKRVKKVTGEHYDPTTLSLLERNKQGWKIDDAEILSQLDKEKRGAEWLAFGADADDNAEPKRKAR
jgi:hypothetical protein